MISHYKRLLPYGEILWTIHDNSLQIYSQSQSFSIMSMSFIISRYTHDILLRKCLDSWSLDRASIRMSVRLCPTVNNPFIRSSRMAGAFGMMGDVSHGRSPITKDITSADADAYSLTHWWSQLININTRQYTRPEKNKNNQYYRRQVIPNSLYRLVQYPITICIMN